MRTISPLDRQLVLRLYARGHSLRTIAKQAGISVSTVVRLTRSASRRPAQALLPDDPPPGYDPALLRRCPGCGGRIYVWPCLLCLVRERRARLAK
jgi:hypothetical protein